MKTKLLQAFASFWIGFVGSASVHPPPCDGCTVQPSGMPSVYGTAYAGSADGGR